MVSFMTATNYAEFVRILNQEANEESFSPNTLSPDCEIERNFNQPILHFSIIRKEVQINDCHI